MQLIERIAKEVTKVQIKVRVLFILSPERSVRSLFFVNRRKNTVFGRERIFIVSFDRQDSGWEIVKMNRYCFFDRLSDFIKEIQFAVVIAAEGVIDPFQLIG